MCREGVDADQHASPGAFLVVGHTGKRSWEGNFLFFSLFFPILRTSDKFYSEAAWLSFWNMVEKKK